MKDRIKLFIDTPFVKSGESLAELKALYTEIGEKPSKCESVSCITKMLTAVQKYYHSKFEAVGQPEAPVKRKYTLKPGIHAFLPGPAVHTNDNTSDEDIEHLIAIYPHIKKLLTD